MIVLCVVVSLLFSVGEGLRLTPFPAGLDRNNPHELSIGASDGAILVQAGPIVGPKQFRKQSRSQQTDIDLPHFGRFVFGRRQDSTPINYCSHKSSEFFISSALGRAPPA
jgi:hypothetical protein